MKVLHIGQMIVGLDIYIRNSIYNLQDVIVLKEWLDHEHTMIIEWRLVCCLNFYRLL